MSKVSVNGDCVEGNGKQSTGLKPSPPVSLSVTPGSAIGRGSELVDQRSTETNPNLHFEEQISASISLSQRSFRITDSQGVP
ncbi:10911_t:CDS:2 [Acaulospora colombiana]|uniref:10911_t:CDS:1 n=1 Tax=Acaulospora colombiana TaxID=27376 RepID=A0ACA9MFP2_9GLOM|nr:10911_t:CDS:2 [Acaulospora colombiana]